MSRNPYKLRCYMRPEGDHLLGVCIDLNIAVRGEAPDLVKKKMTEAIQSYANSLDEANFSDVFPRPAPARFRLEYYSIKLVCCCLRIAKSGYAVFKELAIPTNVTVRACA